MAERIFDKFRKRESAKALDYLAQNSSRTVDLKELKSYLGMNFHETEEAVRRLEKHGYARFVDNHIYQITESGIKFQKGLESI